MTDAKDIAIIFIKPYLNKMIAKSTPELLYDAIINNKDLWEHTPQDTKDKGSSWKKIWGGLFKKYEDKITTNLLLERWIKEDHMDLYNTIMLGYYGKDGIYHSTYQNGKHLGWYWFDNQVKKIKEEIKKSL